MLALTGHPAEVEKLKRIHIQGCGAVSVQRTAGKSGGYHLSIF